MRCGLQATPLARRQLTGSPTATRPSRPGALMSPTQT